MRELRDSQPDRAILSEIHVGRPVLCDVGRIQQVASNLVANALTHGASGSVVKVTAGVEQQAFCLEVWNDGEPISAVERGNIFKPFWRQTASKSRQGLGLGLYICSQIVAAHRGTISVCSDQADGTRFTVRIPLVDGAQVLPPASVS